MYFPFDKEKFITSAAEDLAAGLSGTDKAALLKAPDYTDHHFGLGLYIRNHYIYANKELRLPAIMADGLSHQIFDQTIAILRREEK